MTPYNIYPIKNMEKCIIFVVFYLAFTQQLSFESLFCCAREGQAEQLVAKIQGREGDTEMVERIVLSVIRIQPGSYLRKLGWYWELYFFPSKPCLDFPRCHSTLYTAFIHNLLNCPWNHQPRSSTPPLFKTSFCTLHMKCSNLVFLHPILTKVTHIPLTVLFCVHRMFDTYDTLNL